MNNRNILISLIVALTIICVSLVVGMVILINNKSFDFRFGFDFGSVKLNLIDSFEEEGNSISKLDFNLYSTDVEIKESNTDNLKIEYYSNKEEEKLIKKENSIVFIDENENNVFCIGICNNRRKVVVYVPSSYIGSYDIKTNSGDVKSNINIMDNDIQIETKSGDVYLKDINTINIITISGDVKINKVNKIDLNTISGDIEIKEINKYINLNTISGDVLIKDLDIVSDSYMHTISGDIMIDNNVSDCYIEVKTISGSNRISKNNRKSDLVLKVETTSGDIIID